MHSEWTFVLMQEKAGEDAAAAEPQSIQFTALSAALQADWATLDPRKSNKMICILQGTSAFSSIKNTLPRHFLWLHTDHRPVPATADTTRKLSMAIFSCMVSAVHNRPSTRPHSSMVYMLQVVATLSWLCSVCSS